MKKNLSFIALTVLTVLLVVLMFVLYRPIFSPLLLLIAAIMSFGCFVSAVKDKITVKNILPIAVLCGGTLVFNMVYGADAFLNSFLLLIPVTVLIVLFCLGNVIWKKDSVRRSVNGIIAALLVVVNIYSAVTVNVRLKPKTESLQAGQDEYLNFLKRGSYKNQPNVIVILTDDMGYGDMSLFADTSIRMPNLERIAEKGIVMDNFYSANPVCSPSRFSCLTGRYSFRGNISNVFFPTVDSCNIIKDVSSLVMNSTFSNGVGGMLGDEITIAEVLQATGYKTGAFGKWHLGDYGEYLPNNQGFDYFYGAHYSTDMVPYSFYRNDKIDKEKFDQKEINSILTNEVVNFIDKNKNDPFFVYYASPWPHDPVSVGDDFKGKSKAGTYGDCLEELDFGIGRIIKKLEDEGILDDTLIIFTSDNGPWFDGSTGGMRGRKNNNFNGGQKVPMIVSHPSLLQGEKISTPAMNIDLFPTILSFCGINTMPSDRTIDGENILPLLKGETEDMDRELFFISDKGKVTGILQNEFKYFKKIPSENAKYPNSLKNHLYKLDDDRYEAYNVYDLYPEKASEMADRLAEFKDESEHSPRK